jgi:hypothetical protein
MKIAFRSLIVVILASASLAQGPWVKKDWKQWSKDDCKKILEDSPWAQRWSESNEKMANFSTRTRGTSGVGAESELEVHYVVQFRSALPIREAVVRQAMIASGYDRLEPPQQREMEKQTESFLNRNYDDVIVVHVVYGSNVQEYNRDLATFWQTHYPEGTIPQEAFLNTPRQQKVAPVRLISPKGGAQEFELIFPRQVDGKPLLEPGDKKVSVEFLVPPVGSVDSQGRVVVGTVDSQGRSVAAVSNSTRVFKEFNVDKMMLNGQVVY